MFRQIFSFMDFYLSKQQCGFRKGYTPQYWLLVMPGKLRNAVDKGKYFGALLTDLSKAFDCLSHDSINLFKWFVDNQIKVNSDKCHLITSKQSCINLKIGNILKTVLVKKLLGVKEDNKLNFNEHLDWIIKKASGKVSTLSRILPFRNLTKRRFLMNSFFTSQFSYCPLIWMCHSRTVNNKINKLHKRCLRIIYNDKKFSFKELLETDKSVPIRINPWAPNAPFLYPLKGLTGNEWVCCLQGVKKGCTGNEWVKILQVLATEMFKVYRNISPPIVRQLFQSRNNDYNLRKFSQFGLPNVRSVFCGTESIPFLASKIWNIVRNEFTKEISLHAFKKLTSTM